MTYIAAIEFGEVNNLYVATKTPEAISAATANVEVNFGEVNNLYTTNKTTFYFTEINPFYQPANTFMSAYVY